MALQHDRRCTSSCLIGVPDARGAIIASRCHPAVMAPRDRFPPSLVDLLPHWHGAWFPGAHVENAGCAIITCGRQTAVHAPRNGGHLVLVAPKHDRRCTWIGVVKVPYTGGAV